MANVSESNGFRVIDNYVVKAKRHNCNVLKEENILRKYGWGTWPFLGTGIWTNNISDTLRITKQSPVDTFRARSLVSQ